MSAYPVGHVSGLGRLDYLTGIMGKDPHMDLVSHFVDACLQLLHVLHHMSSKFFLKDI